MAMTEARPLDPGRVVEKDLRDLDYLLATTEPSCLVPPDQLGRTRRRVDHHLVHDQRAHPTSVACALVTALGLDGYLVQPRAVHAEALGRDAFDEPISIRDGCKALARFGLIASYEWAYEVDEIASYVLQHGGPLAIGTDWYDWMFRPDPQTGILKRPHGTAAQLVGGCGFALVGVDLVDRVAEIQLSFGPTWGGWLEGGVRRHGGCARLPLDELRRLLRGNGEAVLLRKAKRPKA